jgi:hypothetical protein
MWNISTIWVAWKKIMQDVYVKLNPGLPKQRQLSTARIVLSPANGTYI